MSLKKNGFSFLLWFLYSALVVVALLGTGGYLAEKNGYAVMFGWIGAGVWTLVCGVLVFLFHKLSVKASSSFLVLEAVAVVLILAVALVWDIRMMSAAGERAAYYEYAMVADGKSVPAVVHGAQYMYLQVLHGLFFLVGNKFMAAVWLQIGLHLLVTLFFYFAVRKTGGVPGALFTLCFASLGPVMRTEAVQLSPIMLYLAVFGAVLLILIGCIGQKNPFICLVGGLFVVTVSYLDVMGLVLIPFFVWGLLTDEENSPTVAKRIGCILTSLLGIFLGAAALFGTDALGSHKKITDVIMAWWRLYRPNSLSVPYLVNEGSEGFEVLVLTLLLGFGVFSFWCRRKRENLTVWIISFLTMLVLLCAGMTTKEVDGSVLLYIMMSVLAGVGLGDSFQRKTILQNIGETTVACQEEPEGKTDEFTYEELSAIKKEEHIQETEDIPKKKVVLLENPLPLPKKHVKKVLDYDRISSTADEKEDDFDIVISDDDDFDV